MARTRLGSTPIWATLCIGLALALPPSPAQEPCPEPQAPHDPSPPDAGVVLGTSLRLRWNLSQRARPKAIYGTDDRRDVFEVTEPELLSLWESTVAMVRLSDLVDRGDGTYTLRATVYGETWDLCPEERFLDQPDPARCSGFLVGEDLVATAGHCLVTSADCSRVAFVFGFRMLDAKTPVLSFENSQVYRCEEILARRNEDGTDWGVIRLDRPVTDRVPLRIRREGKIDLDEALVVIGHPGGLPAKISDGGRVRDNSPEATFVANLDTFVGNSGSAVIHAGSLVVEGVLVRGEEDFVDQGPCSVSKRCPDDGCVGEEATRTTEFASWVPAHPDTLRYELSFGPCGAMVPVAETTDTAWAAENLEAGVEYCWRVRVLSECGVADGPTWRFVTKRDGEVPFRRGDANTDGEVDLSDAVATLGALFLGEGGLLCDDALDSNDDGATDISDPVLTLSHLFLGEGQIPAPGPRSCGLDPVADVLDCAEYPPGC